MKSIAFKNQSLHIEKVAATKLARKFGTPLYVYAGAAIGKGFARLQRAMKPHLGCFAVKANGNLSVLRTLAKTGGGGDVVSAGELQRAIKAGFAPSKIVFSGVGKTAQELEYAIGVGVLQINVESAQELELLASLKARQIPVALRINPQVSAGAHRHIRTGRKGDKFGIGITQARKLALDIATNPSLKAKFKFVGLSVHIGSQITRLKTFEEAWHRLAQEAQFLNAKGIATAHLDGGGGLAIGGDQQKWAKTAIKILAPHCQRVILEPGRSVVGEHGVLLVSVIRTKTSGAKNWLIVDGAMNDLARPALYGAEHPIVAVEGGAVKGSTAKPRSFAVAGPICESGDVFAKGVVLASPADGDVLALLETGAYGAVMGSAYNARPLVGEAMTNGAKFSLVRKPISTAELMKFEPLASWL